MSSTAAPSSRPPSRPQSAEVSSRSIPPSSGGSSTTSHNLPHEERIGKAWRNLVTCIVQGCFHRSEKTAKETTKETLKELDESVLTFIRARMEWHHLISRIESKIQGQEQEMEALENYVRTQPRLGKRKRDVVVVVDQTSDTPANSGPAIPGATTDVGTTGIIDIGTDAL